MHRFVGREREMSQLEESLCKSLCGDGSLAMISGEAGIGKTSLVREFTEKARQQQALVLTGCCYDLSTTPPYGLWLELADRYVRDEHLPELPEVLMRGTGVGDLPNQVALFEMIRNFLESVACIYPLVVVLEDIHWADQASLDLLRYLSRYLDGQPMMVVATYRDDEMNRRHPLFSLIPALVREARAERIELGKLSREQISRLVEGIWPLEHRDLERLVDHLLNYGEANPLFIVEMLRTLEQNEYVTPSGTRWTLADLGNVPVPSLVQQVIEGRLSRLDDESRHFLEVAAVIGHQVEFGAWQAATGTTEEELLGTLEQAIALHLLEPSADAQSAQFVHALTREALYRSILPPRRRLWHRIIAETLAESSHHVPDSIAFHLQQARDPRAVAWLVQAGESAQRSFAWRNAVERFRAAGDLLADDEDRLRERGWLLHRTGRLSLYLDPAAGVADLEQALRIADRTGDRVLHAASLVRHGHLLCFTNEIDRGIEEMGKGADEWDELSLQEKQCCEFFDSIGADLHLNVFRGTWLLHLAGRGRYRECLDVAETFLPEIEAARDRLVADRLFYWLDGYAGIADSRFATGDVGGARHLFETAQHGFAAIGIPVMESTCARAILKSLHIYYSTDDLKERRRLIQEMDAAWYRSAGSLRPDMTPRTQHSQYLVLEGHWDEAMEIVAHDMESHPNATRQSELRSAGAFIAHQRGLRDLAWRHINTLLHDGVNTEPGTVSFYPDALSCISIAAELEIDAGNLNAACEWLELRDHWLNWSGATFALAGGKLLWARFFLQAGDDANAQIAANVALRLAGAPRQPLTLISIYRMLGELARRAGDFEESARQLHSSLELATRCDAPFEHAQTMLTSAELEIERDNREEAGRLLSDARQICERLGAAPALQRIDQLEAGLGGSPARSTGGLTPREAEVLRCLVNGKSDKGIAEELYISPFTVMRHVSSILRKLNVDSRTAAAARAIRENVIQL